MGETFPSAAKRHSPFPGGVPELFQQDIILPADAAQKRQAFLKRSVYWFAGQDSR